MISIALQCLVVIMMVSIGLELQLSQLMAGLRKGTWVLAAIALNLVAVPIAVWAVASGAELSTGMATGFILLAAAPAGPIGPMLSRLSKSDLGFSTGLMVLLGVLGLGSIPLTVHLLIDTGPGVDDGILLPMFVALLLFQVIPLLAAMAMGSRLPELAGRVAKPLALMANLLLVGIVVALLVLRGELLTATAPAVHAGLIVGLLLVMAPVLLVTEPGSRLRSVLTVTAVRNMSVALFLAARFFDDPEVEAAILLWSFWMLVVPGVIGKVSGRFRTNDSQSTPDGRLEPTFGQSVAPSFAQSPPPS